MKNFLNRLNGFQKAIAAILLLVILVVPAYLLSGGDIPGVRSDKNGIKIEVIQEGDGRVLGEVGIVVIDYVAFLEDGTEFDNQKSFVFELNSGNVLEAWKIGMRGMRVGETRRLTVKPQFAYGESGIPGLVPPNSVVIFEIGLVEIR